ncbi:MAG: PA14 domain-containing protein, partial [Victivallales bacterium]
MENKMMQAACAVFLLFTMLLSTIAQPPSTPGNPELYQATFTRAIISWLPSNGTPTPEGYKICRDGVEIASVPQPEFTDTGLTPDTTYVYIVKAYSGSELSLPGATLTIRTLKNLEIENAAVVQQIVDSIDPFGLSADNLILAVQNALTALGHANVGFTQINVPILSGFIDREMAIIEEGVHPSSDSERVADQQELDQILLDNFLGHSFAELYLQSKLVELGEEHWQKGHPDAAETLYDYSLNFMSDHEPSVFNTLNRLAMFRHSIFSTYATRLELVTSLNGHKTQLMRFFDFFPGSTSHFAYSIHYSVSSRYFWNFPDLLYYDNYEQSAFDSALLAIQAAKNIEDNARSQLKYDKITSWQLGTINVSFKTPEGTAMSGMVDVTNTSGTEVYPKTPVPSDIRRFTLMGGEALVPMYKGHKYDLKAYVTVAGGSAIKYDIRNVRHDKGFRTTCDHGHGATVSTLSDPNATGEVLFVSGQPTAPYNLAAAKYVDTFTLSWDWIPPSGNYSLKNFKVFRGGIEIATVTPQTLANIPLESENHTYSYTVTAYDVNDVPSDESLPLLVTPDFTAEQNAYFTWKQQYFGNQPMYDYEDPDNDGLNNYQEYLMGSNPTLAPVSDVKSTIQDVTPGLLVKYYQGTWTKLPDFDTLSPVSTGSAASPAFDSTSGAILASGLADCMGVSFSGYVDVPATGSYRFYLASDEGSRLSLDKIVLVDNDFMHGFTEKCADIYLNAGVHQIRLDYFEYSGSAALRLDWSGPGFSRVPVDAQYLWHTSDVSPLLEEQIAWNKDSDNDRLR